MIVEHSRLEHSVVCDGGGEKVAMPHEKMDYTTVANRLPTLNYSSGGCGVRDVCGDNMH